MKTKQAIKRFTSAKKFYKILFSSIFCVSIYAVFVFAKNKYSNADFGNAFKGKASAAKNKLHCLDSNFALCAPISKADSRFMQSIVFPEIMRYNSLKDGIEAESLRTLYVQFGEAYANFSIGLFQMKPTFAMQVEEKAKLLLTDSIYNELQLSYDATDEESIRANRIERLQDNEWQLVYLTAFVCICNELYKSRTFISEIKKLQWYATVYNAGFDKSDTYISQKIKEANFYLSEGMPGKKFKYASIARWYYEEK